MIGILTETIGLKSILRDGSRGDKTENSWAKGKDKIVIILSSSHGWKGKPDEQGERNLELFMW